MFIIRPFSVAMIWKLPNCSTKYKWIRKIAAHMNIEYNSIIRKDEVFYLSMILEWEAFLLSNRKFSCYVARRRNIRTKISYSYMEYKEI